MATTRYAVHPDDYKSYGTEKIRKEFLIETVFVKDEITHTYSLNDRLIVGGAFPSSKNLTLEPIDQIKSLYFLERREIGFINVGDSGAITVDGVEYSLNYKEALYVGRGAKAITLHPAKSGNALFYYNSAPAHTTYPTQLVTRQQAEVVTLGSLETANHRTINKLLVNSVLPTCQLQMGMTELKAGSVWNTMPPHTHDRRMEAYFYFEVKDEHAVCHFMGPANETRPLWMKNNQAVISPPWSVHCGVGTSNYSFIWGMAGENLDYGDMDHIKLNELR
jgi:4-deoxy-L-threo-5-hexosulose-uronate ketol-isomerase